jgi:hypothetical protein
MADEPKPAMITSVDMAKSTDIVNSVDTMLSMVRASEADCCRAAKEPIINLRRLLKVMAGLK